MTQRTALLAGASGLVGGALLRVLLETREYARVRAIGRRNVALEHPRLEQRGVDFEHLGDHREAFAVQDVFCCLGTTLKKAGSKAAFRKVDYDYPLALARLAQDAGARQFLVVTALGANAGSALFYSRVKGELERALRELGIAGLHIFQPSLLLGQRDEARTGEAVGAVLARALGPVLLGPLRKYRAIDGAVVARAMVREALRDAPGVHVHPSDEIEQLGALG